jgi:subtilisin family serine protease
MNKVFRLTALGAAISLACVGAASAAGNGRAALAASRVATPVTAAAKPSQPDPNRVIITYRTGAQSSVQSAVGKAGGKVARVLARMNMLSASVTPAQRTLLLRDPNVVRIEPDYPRYPMGEVVPYGIPLVKAPEAIAAGADGTGMKVCVIDSGVKSDHEDLAGVSMAGYNSPNETPWNQDSCGHGTHVTGTIAAVGGNGKGVVGVTAGNVSIYAVKVFDGASCAWAYSSDLIDAAQKCQAAGAKIISMSLGGSGSSTAESTAFQNLFDAGILSIAAAGNAGNASFSYPASYDSVMSVAAVDETKTVASFSQFNSQVEIAAPGVGVLSTVPFITATVVAGGTNYGFASAITNTLQGTASGAIVNGGLCDSVGSWSGKVVMCQRGNISFLLKVQNVQSGGGVAALVYNNVDGGANFTLGDGNTSTIPAIALIKADGEDIVANHLGQTGDVSTVPNNNASGYAYYDGTSMATPHVSGVAALVWSANPSATPQMVRDALDSTAEDLGTPGRDNSYGYGLVNALAAANALAGMTPTAPSNLVAVKKAIRKISLKITLTWSGGTTGVDLYRNGSVYVASLSNSHRFVDTFRNTGAGSVTYKVCNAGTSECTSTVTVNY